MSERNVIDTAREEGKVIGLEKGEYRNSVIAVRNMTKKNFETPLIVELLDRSLSFVQQIQKDLSHEATIIRMLQQE